MIGQGSSPPPIFSVQVSKKLTNSELVKIRFKEVFCKKKILKHTYNTDFRISKDSNKYF